MMKRFLVMLAALALVLAACNGDDEEELTVPDATEEVTVSDATNGPPPVSGEPTTTDSPAPIRPMKAGSGSPVSIRSTARVGNHRFRFVTLYVMRSGLSTVTPRGVRLRISSWRRTRSESQPDKVMKPSMAPKRRWSRLLPVFTAANPIASEPALNKMPPTVKRIRRQARSLLHTFPRAVSIVGGLLALDADPT